MQTVEQWMTKDPITIDENATIIEAIHLMKERDVRRFPVTCKGKFCGLLTDRMIKEYMPGKASPMDTWEVHYLLSKAMVKDAMNPHPFTITPDAPLSEAARIIHDNKLNGLCVTDQENRLVGLITVTNLTEALIALSDKD
ncbi:MAG TPA: CBS domain-containing protein [Desulfuromonadaceae bacterium]